MKAQAQVANLSANIAALGKDKRRLLEQRSRAQEDEAVMEQLRQELAMLHTQLEKEKVLLT